jgi:NADH-quinone oxidoreductase subunit E
VTDTTAAGTARPDPHDPAAVAELLARYPHDASSLVMLLQDIQDTFNYLPCEALEQVARSLGVPRAQVFSVATFYKVFSLTPKGRRIVRVCKGTACHVRGAQLVADECERVLGVAAGETTGDGEFTLEVVNCVGACAMAPVVVVGEQYHGAVKPSRVRKLLGVTDAQ